MEVVRVRGEEEEPKTSSGGTFSPRVRASLANFLSFSSSVRPRRGYGGVYKSEEGVEDVEVEVEYMLEEDVDERGAVWWTGGFRAFITVGGTGSDRS